ncbi:MAG: Hint domain-containing protein, partial [Verrucomicrobiae bacterium]|nr:Hint domain-containing protein [Verrucomicrobiae bacterium]
MSGSTIAGTISTTVILNSTPSYLSPLTVTTGGAILVATGYGITTNSSGTVINDGTIISGNTAAISLIGLANSGSVTNSGVILGSTDGIYTGVGVLTLANSGSIAGGVGGHGIDIYTGYVTNTNPGQIYGGSFGAYFYATGGTLNNAGTISAGTSGTGVYLRGGGTVINAGTIAGGAYAVDFLANNSINNSGGVLIVDPGAVFNGSVTSVASLQNTLDLASGSSAGTLNMGGSFSGFDTINIDTGATWTLEGNAAELASGQTITGFTAGDTIDLSGVAATLANFSAGTLSLYGTSGLLDTLTLAEPSSVTSAFFTLTPDTTGTGTDIVLCFYPGTRIATPEGDAAVEDLRTGDAVLTANG